MIASFAEQTTPSRPDDFANCAKSITCSSTDSEWQVHCMSSSSMLVKTVTAISNGLCVVCPMLHGCFHHARPPEAWTLSIHTPKSAAARHALATVLGIS